MGDVDRKLLFYVGSKGLAIFDVSDCKAPVRLSKTTTGVLTTPGKEGGGGGDVAVQGSYAYVVGGKGMATFDVKDAKSPSKVWTGKTGMGTWAGGASVAL